MKRTLLLASVVAAVAVVLAGCEENSDQIQRRQQEQISMQATQSVGMPAIVNFAEKRMMKDILELRDQNKATTTYIVDMNGKLHKICTSVGYGLPYATQYTNPMRVTTGAAVLPQADPNGLFSPSNAEGTWVLCVNPKTGKPEPIYVEPRIVVSPFALDQHE
jgi:hypothetical protein